MVKRPSVVIVIAAVFVASSASAQDFMPTYAPDFQASMALNTMVGNQLERDSRRGGASSSSARNLGPSGSVGGVSTSYRASPAVTSRVKRQFAAFVGSTGGDEAGIAAAMERDDFFARWGRHVSQYGLRRGSVTDAMTAYWILNWQIANDVRQIDRSQVSAVRSQVQSILGGNPGFSRLDDAQKQEMAEAMILNFIVQSVAYEEAMAANHVNMQRRLQNAAATRFNNEMGLNLRSIRLTSSGFTR
jgi:hypothetical protein